MSDSDSSKDFNHKLKVVCAVLGIDVHPHTDASGRTEFGLDRAGMERLRDSMLERGYPELAAGVQNMIDRGPDVWYRKRNEQ